VTAIRSRDYLLRFFVVEVVLFSVVGLVCWLLNFSYSQGLTVAGATIMILRFVFTPLQRSEEEDDEDESVPPLNMLVVGALPVIAGVLLAFFE
jgi:hypothetical protein